MPLSVCPSVHSIFTIVCVLLGSAVNKGEVAGVILLLCARNACSNSEKNGENRCTFAEVIVKLKQGYHFLDHPIDVH